MSPRTKDLIAISLAMLYSMVGLAGESIHYLVEDISLAVRQVQVDRSGGYFHSHQPDNHVHFHHHHHHGQGQLADLKEDAKLRGEQNNRGVKPDEQFHYPHACPLLTIASQLKLGDGGYSPLIVESEASHASLSEFNLCHGFELASLSLARGPPSETYLT